MIKLMLADDEQYEREYLHKIISQRYQGIIDIVYMAIDGVDVLEKIEEYSTDIVLLDILMPRIDGLEVASQLLRKYPQLQIIIISAYGEFSYAKQAIKLGVKDFLVKPYLDDELVETLDKVISEISKKSIDKINIEQADGVFDFHEDIDKDIVWDAAFGRKKNKAMKKELTMWGVQDYSFKCIVFFNHSITKTGTVGYEILKGIFCIKHTHVVINSLFRHLVVFAFAEDESAYLAINGCIRKARAYIRELDHETVFCGTSGIYKSNLDLPKSYQEAVKYILEYSNPEIKEALKLDIKNSVNLCDLEDNVYFYLVSGDHEQSLFWLKKIWELFAYADKKHNFRRSLMSIIRKINKITESRLHTEEAVRLFKLFLDTPEDDSYIYTFLEEYVDTIIRCRQNITINNNIFMVRDAKNIISDDYDKILSLQSVSEALGISTGYLSKCFKNVEGVSFTEYLTDYRLSKAKELMRLGGSTITEIAYKVGFSDPNYFGKCFKKQENISPRQYLIIQTMDTNAENPS